MPKLSKKITKSMKSLRGGVKKTKSRKTSRKSLRRGVKLTKSKKPLRGGIKRKKSRRVLLGGQGDGQGDGQVVYEELDLSGHNPSRRPLNWDGSVTHYTTVKKPDHLSPPLPPRPSRKTAIELSKDLFKAIQEDNLDKLEDLIGNLSELKSKKEIMGMKKGGRSLLFNAAYATAAPNLEMVKYLVDNGANIEDIADNDYNSVLDIALHSPDDYPGLLEALVKRNGVFKVSQLTEPNKLRIYKFFLKNDGDWLVNDSGNIVHFHENQIKRKPANIEGDCFNFIDKRLITRK